jgi:hypothetical protein
MIQHYRTKQRQYWQWKCALEGKKECPSYYPPHLRQLRSEWFVKRYEKYGRSRQSSDSEKKQQYLKEDAAGESDMGEPEILAHKIWRWLKTSDPEEEEERGRSLRRQER